MAALNRRLVLVGGLLLLAASGASAQLPFATPTSGLAFGVGMFGYGQHRLVGDDDFRVSATAGWRRMFSDVYVEPHVRLLIAGSDGRPCSVSSCPREEGMTQDMPGVWPGVAVGYAFGDESRAHSLGASVAVGLESRIQPLLGVHYEFAIRHGAIFVEASVDRGEWGVRHYDGIADENYLETESRWMNGFTVGGRVWLRQLAAPAPKPRRTPDLITDDAGILAPAPPAAKPDESDESDDAGILPPDPGED